MPCNLCLERAHFSLQQHQTSFIQHFFKADGDEIGMPNGEFSASLASIGGDNVKQWMMIAGVFCVLTVSGCMTEANQQGEAKQIVKTMHLAMQTGDWDAALALYGKEFFTGHDKSAWRDKLASMPVRFGKLLEIKESFMQKDPRYSGEFYIYGFRLIFERGVLNETITVFQSLERVKMTITGHLFKFKNQVLR